jgi:hypothetical protein
MTRLPGWIVVLAFVVPVIGCRQPAVPTHGDARDAGSGVEVQRTDGAPCSAEPREPFDVTLETPMSDTSLEFAGILEAIEPADPDGRVSYRITAAGASHRLMVRGATLPLHTGGAYEARIERVGGSPPASGLLIRDATGLVFAGASEQRIGAHVLTGGVPGFTLQLETTNCPSRAQGDCFRSAVNRALAVAHGDARATLYHGDVARFGDFEVRCLIAQDVDYGGRCPDFAFHAVSFTVARATP